MRFLQFILSHSIFIACCAAGLCYQTNVLLAGVNDINIFGFVFCSTLCGYNFYWLLSKFYFSKRRIDGAFLKKHFSFFLLFSLAAAGTLFFLFRVWYLLPYVAVGTALTLLYSLPLWPFEFSKKLQRAGFFKTTLLSLTWAYVTVVLPAVTISHIPFMPVAVLFCARFSFMLLLCIIFDMRDISVDKMHGLHSLATDVGRKSLGIIINMAFFLYIFAGLMVRYYFHSDNQIIAFGITGLLVLLVYRLSLRPRGYIFYYFLVDGLMLISALAAWVATLI